MDLDGKGQTTGAVHHMYDAASGEILSLELPIDPLTVDGDGRRFALTVSEYASGGVDVNADGDLDDPVLHVYRADRSLMNLGVLAFGVYVGDSLVAFAGVEGLQIYDFATRRITDVGLFPRWTWVANSTLQHYGVQACRPKGPSLTELKALRSDFLCTDASPLAGGWAPIVHVGSFELTEVLCIVRRNTGAQFYGDRRNRNIQVIDDPPSCEQTGLEDTELPCGGLVPIDPAYDLS